MAGRWTLALIIGIATAIMAWTGLGFGPVHAQSEEAASTDERIFMMNALWFKPDGGAEKYAEYVAAATPFVAKYGGSSTGAFIPETAIIGQFDADLIFFVEWPNQAAFMKLVSDPDYQAVSHLREEAIRDSFLIKCKPAQ